MTTTEHYEDLQAECDALAVVFLADELPVAA
jgi:hypothetical protein